MPSTSRAPSPPSSARPQPPPPPAPSASSQRALEPSQLNIDCRAADKPRAPRPGSRASPSLSSVAMVCTSPLDAQNSAVFSGSPCPSPSASSAPPVIPRPAAFLEKLFELVDDRNTDKTISWNFDGSGFIVWDTQALCQGLLPRYFAHTNFSSLVRQLNTYGFRKIDPNRWEFSNFDFVRGQRERLVFIRRRKPASTAALHHQSMPSEHRKVSNRGEKVRSHSEMLPAAKKVRFGSELTSLSKEVCILRQRLQEAVKNLHALWQRLQESANREKHLITFIAKALQNPSFQSRPVQPAVRDAQEMLEGQMAKDPLALSVRSDDEGDDTDRVSRTSGASNSDRGQQLEGPEGVDSEETNLFSKVESGKHSLQLFTDSLRTEEEENKEYCFRQFF